MKKILFSAVSALALASFAADSTQFGAMQIVSTNARTLVAIPWDNTVAGGGDIAVSNLVLTANLTTNDTLDVIDTDGTSLNRWTLRENDTTKVKYWDSGNMVGEGWQAVVPDADVATVKRGSSVILIRQAFTNNLGAAIPFFVMGQVASTGSSTTITAGTTNAPIYNMIAPPSTVAQKINGDADWNGTISANDRIFIPNSPLNIELKYEDKVWKNQQTTTTLKYVGINYDDEGKITDKEVISESDIPLYDKVLTNKTTSTSWAEYTGTIPVGTGFWYLSKGGSPTVTWKDEPITTK